MASQGKPTMFGAATGSIAGLATITPASGFVGPMPALAIGLLAAVCVIFALNMKGKLGYDDSLSAFGVHGVGGILGTLGAGLFAEKIINPSGADGLFFGNPHQFIVQIMPIAAVVIYSFAVTFILLKLIDWSMGPEFPRKTR